MSSQAGSSYTAPQPRCSRCNVTFSSRRELFMHQEQAGHLCCDACDQSFHAIKALWVHRANDHIVSQELVCPGCSREFATAGTWIHHVEHGECPVIFRSDISEDTAQIMDFIARKLRECKVVDDQPVDLAGPSHITDVWGDKWEDEHKFDVQQHPEEFPRTAKQEFYQGSSKQSDLLTANEADDLEQHPENAWAQKKNLFPEKRSQPAISPPPLFLESLQQPVPLAQPSGERIIDPDHLDFNVAVFWNPILETYKCPHMSCNSKFKKSNGLINHLRSPAHTAPPFRCPGCKEKFRTASAWSQHAETVSTTKCRIRETEIYAYAINAITKGALDVSILDNFIGEGVKVRVDENWVTKKRSPKPDFVPGSEAWINTKQAGTSKLTSGSEKMAAPRDDVW